MPKLSDLLKATVTLSIEVGDTSVSVVAYALWDGRLADREWDEARTLQGRDYFAKVLPALCQSWDLVDAQDRAIPVTAKAILSNGRNAIPLAFLRRVEEVVLMNRLDGRGKSE